MEAGVERAKLVDRVVLSKQFGRKEVGERCLEHYTLVDRLPDHLPDKVEHAQVVRVGETRRGRRVELPLLVVTEEAEVGVERPPASTRALVSRAGASQRASWSVWSGPPGDLLAISRRSPGDLLEKLLEHAEPVDPRLLEPELIDELDPDRPLERGRVERAELHVPILEHVLAAHLPSRRRVKPRRGARAARRLARVLARTLIR